MMGQQLQQQSKQFTKRKARRQQAILFNLQNTFPTRLTLVLALTVWCWFGTLAYSHHKLALLDDESLLMNVHFGLPKLYGSSKEQKVNNVENSNLDSVTKEHRFLIFEADRLAGQGAGNLMNGLLAVNLIGEEFDRVVCIIPDYSFLLAFELVNATHQQLCDQFFQEHPPEEVSEYGNGREKRIHMVNYQEPPNECKLKKRLESTEDDLKYIYVQANTYPRWRSVPPNYFFQLYRAKQELLDMLPYDANYPPTTVVHLRQEDGLTDKRKGLDEASLEALGNLLASPSPEDANNINDDDNNNIPYLVTNHVYWYDFFELNYGWLHPNWNLVSHSALKKDWGKRNKAFQLDADDKDENDKDDLYEKPEMTIEEREEKERADKKIQDMQLWADWYTILTAQRVYHTHSDFSISATHWAGSDPSRNNESVIWSRTIMGVTISIRNTKTNEYLPGKLNLEKKFGLWTKTMPPMVNRTGSDLHNCNDELKLASGIRRSMGDPLALSSWQD